MKWSEAFYKSLETWLLIFGWEFLGFIIAIVFSGGALITGFSNPTVLLQSLGPIFLGLFVGFGVAQIGVIATLIKVFSEETSNEVLDAMEALQKAAKSDGDNKN